MYLSLCILYVLSPLHTLVHIVLCDDILLVFFMFIYFCVWETARMWVGERQREVETQNQKQAPGSELSAQRPDTGLELMDCEIMTWAEIWRSADWVIQAPKDGLHMQSAPEGAFHSNKLARLWGALHARKSRSLTFSEWSLRSVVSPLNDWLLRNQGHAIDLEIRPWKWKMRNQCL